MYQPSEFGFNSGCLSESDFKQILDDVIPYYEESCLEGARTPPPELLNRYIFEQDDMEEDDLLSKVLYDSWTPDCHANSKRFLGEETFCDIAGAQSLPQSSGVHSQQISYPQNEPYEPDKFSLHFSEKCALDPPFGNQLLDNSGDLMGPSGESYDYNYDRDLDPCSQSYLSTPYSPLAPEQQCALSPGFDQTSDNGYSSYQSPLPSILDTSYDASNYSSATDSASPGGSSSRGGAKRMALTDLTEEQKYLRIRDQNNEASRKYRQSKKEKNKRLKEEWDQLTNTNRDLKKRYETLLSLASQYEELKVALINRGFRFPLS